MTFKDALQAEINLQGLSVAQIAEGSSVSKGAIYNILNGTTEDARIRPATRKALAAACNREVRSDGAGVVFVEAGQVTLPAESVPQNDAVHLRWVVDRLFLKGNHAKQVFDWLHVAEEKQRLPGIGLVNRVYQNRPDFLSLVVQNEAEGPVTGVWVNLTVSYDTLDLDYAFSVRLTDVCAVGQSLEETVYICAGPAYRLSIDKVQIAIESGQKRDVRPPDPFDYAGGCVD